MKRIVSIILLMIIPLFLYTPAFADPTQELETAKEEEEEITQEIEDNTAAIEEINGSIYSLCYDIELLNVEIKSKQTEIEALSEKISAFEEEIEITGQSLSDQYDLYYERVRALEETGKTSYLALIFSATSLSDLLNRIDCVTEILNYDKEQLKILEQKEESLKKQREDLSTLKADQNVMIRAIRVSEEKLRKKAESLAERKEFYLTDNSILTSRLSELSEAIEVLETRVSGNGYAVVQGTPTEIYEKYVIDSGEYLKTAEGTQIVKYALGFNGGTYVWGGSKPSDGGFDCSGFVSYVYKQFGYDIMRNARNQFEFDGVIVDKEDLQPGDLVFFRHLDTTTVEHVGMYIGDGYILHAASTDQGIIVSDMYRSWYQTCYLGAKRIIPLDDES